MTLRIEALKQYFVLDKAHHAVRVPAPGAEGAPYRDAALPAHRRSALRLKAALEAETPVIFPEERIVATRTRPALPGIFTEEEWRGIESRHFIHERGYVSNLSPDYERILQEGLIAQRARLQNGEYGDSVRMTIDAVLDFARRYREEALRQGQADIAARLERVPAYGARTFPEALQSLRILHYAMWCEGEYHNTLGRFDQYMYPYFQRDRESGALAPEEALEWLEEFFLSLNRDSDLYPGMQQGDNGQSMVLGGTARGGGEGFNPLSEACLAASRELGVIDPKINLRVNRDTPLSTYLLGTRLTRRGLGFPQYENDDVVIPGLIGLGYAPEDAQNYVVAACWEFIIPGKGADIPNIGALPFASIVNRVLRETLPSASGMEEILAAVRAEIFAEARRMASAIRDIYMIPAPYLSLFFENCVERSRDISLGCVYNNFGFHGTGLATAVDSLAAVEQAVFAEGLSPQELLRAMDADFAGADALRYHLANECPKFGDDDGRADRFASILLADFADALRGLTNERGGCFRPGTGSAMYYISHAEALGATADGRRAETPLPANYAPSLGVKLRGPVSLIRSFTKPDLARVINGGPLTIEFSDTAMKDEDSLMKVAALVREFILRGGHQLQLNTLNRALLLDAQAHPENHKNLIVRVWGWSGYFVELDKCYQDHILRRAELTL